MMLLAMGLIALCAMAWLARPLISTQVLKVQGRRAANIAAYRQRLRELENDRAAGLVDADTLAGLKEELAERLLLDADSTAGAQKATVSRSVALAVALIVLVPLLGLAGYINSGSWATQQKIASAPLQKESLPEQEQDQPDVEAMVAALAQRLQQSPDDIEGWVMLGRSYFVMQRYGESAQAYAKANALSHASEPSLLVSEGESLALANDQNLLGRPAELFDQALALDGENVRALWYGGLAAEQAGNQARAQELWKNLSAQELPDPLREVLAQRLAEARVAPAAEDDSAAASADAFALNLRVTISKQLKDQLPADATLFVFAKAIEGPPMPLAVYRGKVSELPLDVRLDDSMAMLPTHKLSQFDAWTLTARVSRSGQPQSQSGDWEGSMTVARRDLGTSALHLEVDQVVP